MPEGVLFVHNGFPGQFRALAEALAARGVRCCAIGHHDAADVEGVELVRYALPRGASPTAYPPAVAAESDILRASMAAQMAMRLKEMGWDPQVIVGHPGWGEMAFMDQMFPNARQVLYPEHYWRGPVPGPAFDPEFEPDTLAARMINKAKPAVMALQLAEADAVVCPTAYQAATLPEAFRRHLWIIHEGVDTETLRPGAPKQIVLRDGTRITPGDPVITHVNNHLEPLRGLHILARAVPRLLTEVPEARVLILGQEGQTRGYAGEARGGGTWKDLALKGVELDPARVHFLGWNDHAFMLEVLRISTAHVYYSYPFVLSWSLVEAMALGCYVIGSDTAPLHDAIEDGVNGRLLPFFDVEALSQAMIQACREPHAADPLRAAARATAVAKFDRAKGLSAWFDLLRQMGLTIPPP